MERIFSCLLLTLLVIPFSAFCHAAWWWDGSTASITSFKDPAFSHYKVSKIMICSTSNDLRDRDTIEGRFVKKFADDKFTIEPLPSLKFLSPTRQYTSDEFCKIMYDNDIRSIMLVSIIASYDKQRYIPETSYSTISGYLNGNNLNATQHTTKSGGYYVSAQDLKFEIRILDVVTGNTVWVAQSLASGKRMSTFNNLIDVVIHKAFKQMQKDGLLTQK